MRKPISSSASLLHHFLLQILIFFLLQAPSSFAEKKSYVVYLGSHSHDPDLSSSDFNVRNSHTEFLGSFLGRYADKDSHQNARFASRVDYHKALPSTPRTIRRIKTKYFPRSHFGTKLVVSAAKNDQLRFDDEFPQEPFWLSLIADVIWGVKSLFAFLVEQPSQLKYIEWPSFSNTVRTATLTLVLVALLIVALASVDSALSYMLALVLRKAS